MVSFLLNGSKFHTLFWCFHRWLWTTKYRLFTLNSSLFLSHHSTETFRKITLLKQFWIIKKKKIVVLFLCSVEIWVIIQYSSLTTFTKRVIKTCSKVSIGYVERNDTDSWSFILCSVEIRIIPSSFSADFQKGVDEDFLKISF